MLSEFERGEAEAADEIGRSVEAAKPAEDRVDRRQVVDQHHRPVAVAPGVESDRRSLPIDRPVFRRCAYTSCPRRSAVRRQTPRTLPGRERRRSADPTDDPLPGPRPRARATECRRIDGHRRRSHRRGKPPERRPLEHPPAPCERTKLRPRPRGRRTRAGSVLIAWALLETHRCANGNRGSAQATPSWIQAAEPADRGKIRRAALTPP